MLEKNQNEEWIQFYLFKLYYFYAIVLLNLIKIIN